MAGVSIGLSAVKGGVGRSLLAANLAVALAQKGLSVVLVDWAPVCQSVLDLYWDVQPERAWDELLPVLTELTSRHLELVLTPYEAVRKGSLALLAAPREAGERSFFPSAGVGMVLSLLAQQFDVVVVDLPLAAHRLARKVLDRVTMPLLVIAPDMATVRNTRCWLRGPGQAMRPRIVLNQQRRGMPMRQREIETYLDLSVTTVLPFDAAAAWQTVGLGRPFVLRGRRGLPAAMREWASRLYKMALSRAEALAS